LIVVAAVAVIAIVRGAVVATAVIRSAIVSEVGTAAIAAPVTTTIPIASAAFAAIIEALLAAGESSLATGERLSATLNGGSALAAGE
jgi:hypothetical protein